MIDYLRMLSGPPDTQVDWLKNHDLPAQELWFEYDDYMTGADTAASQGVITPAEWQALSDLNAYFTAASFDLERKGAAVLTDPEWAKVRTLAAAAADELTKQAPG